MSDKSITKTDEIRFNGKIIRGYREMIKEARKMRESDLRKFAKIISAKGANTMAGLRQSFCFFDEEATYAMGLAFGLSITRKVWPLSNSTTPDIPLNDTFGPRIKSGGVYDFHRGIDIPASIGTPVYAFTNGTVRIAGTHPDYDDPLVQLTHSSSLGRFYSYSYYSNYMHLSSWTVSAGDTVRTGDLIGYTGVSSSGYPHLHFEIRKYSYYQYNCVHPLLYLPYTDTENPTVSTTKSGSTVTVDVTLPASQPDLNRVGIVSLGGYPFTQDVLSFDMMDLNLACGSDYTILDNPEYGGYVTITPVDFSSASTLYEISFEFTGLVFDPSKMYFGYADDIRDNRTTHIIS